MKCDVCGQVILPNEAGMQTAREAGRHLLMSDCITATKTATARRCIFVLRSLSDAGQEIGGAFADGGSALARSAIAVLCAEFGIEEPKV